MKIFIRTLWVVLILTAASILYSCSGKEEEPDSWQPINLNDGWQISTAEEQGLDPVIIYNIYIEAKKLDNLLSLLIVKNGYLVAEHYYNDQTISDAKPVASVTKSIVSALTGIALEEKYIVNTDQKLKDFFPEIEWGSSDPKKSEITIEHLLQMRSGYPWEEVYGLIDTLWSSTNWIHFLKDFPLVNDPGTEFGYSNFTAHMMGIIISRSTGQSLISFALNNLFNDMGISVPYWPVDASGYNNGCGDILLTPRSLAKFGQLYLDNGGWNNLQLIPSEWVDTSLQIYSPTTYGREILTNINNLGYGYLWWSGVSGDHPVWFAWGHGGQLVVIVRDLNMVVVTTATIPPDFGTSAWQKSKAVMELAGRLISRL